MRNEVQHAKISLALFVFQTEKKEDFSLTLFFDIEVNVLHLFTEIEKNDNNDCLYSKWSGQNLIPTFIFCRRKPFKLRFNGSDCVLFESHIFIHFSGI